MVDYSENADSEHFQKYFCLVPDNRRLLLDEMQVSACIRGAKFLPFGGEVQACCIMANLAV